MRIDDAIEACKTKGRLASAGFWASLRRSRPPPASRPVLEDDGMAMLASP